MARPQSFSDDALLDAAQAVVAARGQAASVEDVAQELRVAPGTVYYRAGSRRALLARLWVRSIRRFHDHLLAALDQDDPDRALAEAAVTVVSFCRRDRSTGRALTLFRWEQLAADPPDGLESDIATLNDRVFARLAETVQARFGRVDDQITELATTAVQLVPYAMVRQHLDDPGRPIPPWIDDAVRAAVPAMLATADGPRRHAAPNPS